MAVMTMPFVTIMGVATDMVGVAVMVVGGVVATEARGIQTDAESAGRQESRRQKTGQHRDITHTYYWVVHSYFEGWDLIGGTTAIRHSNSPAGSFQPAEAKFVWIFRHKVKGFVQEKGN